MFRIHNAGFRLILNLLVLFLVLSAAGCKGVEDRPQEGVIYHHFPSEIDPAGRYLIYLHGKIIEDQGLPAISPEFGEYQYQEILDAFKKGGFFVISERRSAGSEAELYAKRVAGQVEDLLEEGVPAGQISVVGASKGAGITIFVSNLLNNPDFSYVLLAICHPDLVEELIQEDIGLSGKVLSIYDQGDEYAGSCHELFNFSLDQGLSGYEEIQLSLGIGHGLLYQPYEEWIQPTLNWVMQ